MLGDALGLLVGAGEAVGWIPVGGALGDLEGEVDGDALGDLLWDKELGEAEGASPQPAAAQGTSIV